jgi:hypothetical protein
MTVAKSAYTGKTSKYNRAAGVNAKTQEAIINKHHKDATNKGNLDPKEEDFNLDRIKKYFENVLNEQHFLNNYAKARQRILEETG